MNFKESKAIYLQIADRICDEVLLGQYQEEERIPSVREYAAVVEVNANTVMRSYDYLQTQGVIYNKRGIGYFVSVGARKLILSLRKEYFPSGKHASVDPVHRGSGEANAVAVRDSLVCHVDSAL